MAILATFEDEELSRIYTEVAHTNIVYETGVVGNSKAVQQRTINRYDAIRTYDIQYGGMSPAEQLRLNEFFITKRGRAIGFRFYPPFDRQFANDIIGVGDGTTVDFYLKRNYRSRSNFVTRRILKPIHPLVTILIDGYKVIIADPDGDITPEGDFPIVDNPITVDWNQGKITFTTAPAIGAVVLVAQGEYDVPVYFDTDSFSASDYGPFADAESVRLVEILPAALDAEGNDISNCLLGFVRPLSGSAVPLQFDVTFTSANLDAVSLFVNGAYVGTSGASPAFAFLDVDRPVTSSAVFELEAIGYNYSTGGFTIARISLMGGIDAGGMIFRGDPMLFLGSPLEFEG